MRVNRLFLPATYSFLLPGLGQVYQGSYVKGVLFFSAFSTLNFAPQSRLISPLAVLLAVLEAYWSEKRRPEPATPPISEFRGRNLIYSLVGVVGAILWIFSVSPAWLSLGDVMEMQHRAARLERAIHIFRSERGRFPQTLNQIGDSRDRFDPWGSAFEYEVVPDGFVLRSPGPDRKSRTADDAVFRYH
jgi:hypothetical protein